MMSVRPDDAVFGYPRRWELSVPCPHCGHEITQDYVHDKQREASEAAWRELRKPLIDMWKAGSTLREIAEKFNTSSPTIKSRLEEAGVDTSQPPPTRKGRKRPLEDYLKAVAMRDDDGETFRSIGESFGVSAHRAKQIYDKAHRMLRYGRIQPRSAAKALEDG